MGKRKADLVPFYVCYPTIIEVDGDDLWKWKYVKGEITNVSKHFILPKESTFDELCEEIINELKIDTSLYDFEMKVIPPVPKAVPITLDSDNAVKKFLWMCGVGTEYLLVNLKEKARVIEVRASVERYVERYVASEVPNIDDVVHIDGNVEDQVPIFDMDVDSDGYGDNVLEDTNVCEDDDDDEGYDDDDDEGYDDDDDQDDQDPLLNYFGEGAFIETIENSTGATNSMGATNSKPLNRRCRLVIPEYEDLKRKDDFDDKDLLINKVEYLAVKYHFEFNTEASTTKLYVVKCAGEGCKWRLRARAFAKSERFEVRKYYKMHTCLPMCHKRDHKHASYKLIGRHYASKFKKVDRVYTPDDLIDDFHAEFGYKIKYDKALAARRYGESIIRGSPRMSYEMLPKFLHRLEASNPGTKTDILTKEGSDEFLYCYLALGACISGYAFMRPVISVDGTHLKTRFKGTLLVATCQDANGQIFPLAWAIVAGGETIEAWTWFFIHLKEITGDCEDVAIISDRAKSIQTAFNNVFKKAQHGHCIYHIQKNLRTHFPGRGVAEHFIPLAKAYTEGSFINRWNDADALCDEKKKLGTYLLKEEFPYWARCKFKGMRYNIMTSNNAESINSKLNVARKSNPVGLLDRIREFTQQWFAERRKESREWKESDFELPPKHEERIEKRYKKVNRYVVQLSSGDEYDVYDRVTQANYTVDVSKCTCSCRKFDLDQFPCYHGVAAIKHINNDARDYVSHYYTSEYWMQGYSGSVHALANEEDCVFPDTVANMKVYAPTVSKQHVGHPPDTDRILSAGEVPKRVVRCSKCRKTGHNKARCKVYLKNKNTVATGDDVV